MLFVQDWGADPKQIGVDAKNVKTPVHRATVWGHRKVLETLVY